VLAWIEGNDLIQRRAHATILLEYHRSKEVEKQTLAFPLDEAVRNYNFAIKEYDECKTAIIAFMTPLVDAAYSPAMNHESNVVAVKGRILNIQHTKPHVVTPFVESLTAEFVGFLFPPGTQKLEPKDYDYVSEKQNKPAQRRILEDSSLTNDKKKRAGFIKKEAYSGIKDPRIITPDEPGHKVSYSKYMYSLAEYLKGEEKGEKRFKWFMPGHTPCEVAERLAEILSNAQLVSIADLVRFDGTVNSYVRDMFRRALVRGFAPEYHNEIQELFIGSFNKTVRLMNTEDGMILLYESLDVILSGMSDTSIMGTVISTFTVYVGLRTTKNEFTNAFHTPDEAWDIISNKVIAMGDDIDAADVSAETVRKGAALCGCKSDAYEVSPGSGRVVFLSRVYSPDVWGGDPDNCAVLLRQLAKFHTTVNLAGVTPIEKLTEKCRSYLLSDRETPILGAFCSKFERLAGGLFRQKRTLAIEKWQSDLDLSSQYPNSNITGWMHEYSEESVPHFDTVTFMKWLDQVSTQEDMLSPPLFCDSERITTKREVVVNGDVYGPDIALVTDVTIEPESTDESVGNASLDSKVKKTRRKKRGRSRPV